jgi:uncharacterized membrane protein YbhN (UPF0104 family)
LVKAYLIKKSFGSPKDQGASAVFTERFTDFVVLLILSLVGLYSIEEDMRILAIAAGGIAAIFLVIFLPGAIPLLLTILGRIPIAARVVGRAQDVYVSARPLLSPVLLLQGLLLGVVAWFAECAGFFFVLKGFGVAVSLFAATFIYAFATIFCALTLLSGGIGATEGSMTGPPCNAKSSDGRRSCCNLRHPWVHTLVCRSRWRYGACQIGSHA